MGLGEKAGAELGASLRKPMGRAALASILSLAAAIVASFLISGRASAGSTGTAQLLQINGSGAAAGQGDFVSASANLDTYHRFYVVVPSGATRLDIDLFDADVNLAGGTNDLIRTAANTGVRYRVYNPSGTQVFTVTLAAASCGTIGGGTCDNVWANIYTTNSPIAGHYEIRVDMSSAITTGDDVNGLGIRAHDGTSGSGGTEYNVYSPTYLPVGLSATGSATFTYYPWVTTGCSIDAFDYDTDRNTIAGNSWSLASRDSSFSATIANASLSKNAAWKKNAQASIVGTQSTTGYGLWTSAFTIAADATTTSNYATIYIGTEGYTPNAGAPPSANPEAGTARIYFPTDSGAAPVEPYMEHFIGHRSGANPMTKNSLTTLEITQRIYNPTAKSISFSGTYGGNTRQAQINVPTSGGRNTYQGNASVTSGASITSQPSVGGVGDVVWSPGTMASGSNAAVSFRVASTPSNNNAYAVTGAESARASSTLALYLDQTGNTTQANANPELGGLCRLTEQASVSVFAEISNVAQHSRRGQRTIEWDTTTELGTIGFVVEKMGADGRYRRIHEGYIPALLAPQGGHYAVIDNTPSTERSSYVIYDVDTHYVETTHGPYAVSLTPATGTVPSSLAHRGFGSVARAWPTLDIARTPRVASPRWASRASTGAGDALHIAVRELGLTRVPAATLAEQLGRPESEVTADLLGGEFALTVGGESVPWTTDATGSALIFYAAPRDSIYARDTIYRLSRGTGEVMERGVAAAPGAGAAPVTYPFTTRVEEDRFPGTAVAPDPESDYWHWKVVSSLNPDLQIASVDVPLEGVASDAGPAQMVITGYAITNNPHYFHVEVNGVSAGQIQFPREGTYSLPIELPAGVLHDGVNTVTLTAERVDTVDSSIYLDAFDVTYPRNFVANDSRLLFESGVASPVTVGGFASADVTLVDITDASHARVLTASLAPAMDGSYTLAFGAEASRHFVAATVAGMHTPTAVWPDSPSALRSDANSAEYIVIAPSEFKSAAVRLANLRIAQGRSAVVVELEDIYDEFNHGTPNPHAIADFLSYAHAVWGVGPSYVALVGSFSFDYRDVLGLGGNIMPSLMLRTSRGLYPGDNTFVDFDHNGTPDIAIGRLPVTTPDQFSTLVDKIEAYEAAEAGDWTNQVVLVSDGAVDVDFQGMTAGVLQRVPSSVSTEVIDLLEIDVTAARITFTDAVDRGAVAINYLGHGGSDHLSEQNLFDTAGAAALNNGARLPIVTAGSCLVSGFGMPGVASVGEALVHNPNGGAIAVWSPSSISDAVHGKELAAAVLENVLEGRRRPLGDAVQEAVRFLAEQDIPPTEFATFTLLGDPALLMQAPEDVVRAPLPGEETDGPGPIAVAPIGNVASVDGPPGVTSPPGGGCNTSETLPTSFATIAFSLALVLLARRKRPV